MHILFAGGIQEFENFIQLRIHLRQFIIKRFHCRAGIGKAFCWSRSFKPFPFKSSASLPAAFFMETVATENRLFPVWPERHLTLFVAFTARSVVQSRPVMAAVFTTKFFMPSEAFHNLIVPVYRLYP